MESKTPPRNKPAVDSGEYYGIRIRRDGTWEHEGAPIKRHNLAKLFSTVLKIDEKGDYWLETPAERGRIEVEDVPFIAVELDVLSQGAREAQQLRLRTNMDDWVTVGPDHPLTFSAGEDGQPAPYVMVRDGLRARLSRPVYYELAALAQEDETQKGLFGLWSLKSFYPVATV